VRRRKTDGKEEAKADEIGTKRGPVLYEKGEMYSKGRRGARKHLRTRRGLQKSASRLPPTNKEQVFKEKKKIDNRTKNNPIGLMRGTESKV